MGTEYEIRCVAHDDSWPGVIGLRRYQIPSALQVIHHRAALIELGSLSIDWEVSPWHMPGLPELAEFLAKHSGCELNVWDEYGREIVNF